MHRIITLTTDFGLTDEFVGVMKGIILTHAPLVRIVDLSHQIPPQDIRRASLLLNAAYQYFPADTIHLAVVDPGVGSARLLILVRAAGHLFLGPDNGLFTPLYAEEIFEAAYAVECREFFLQPISPTFHGRDILAPVAARLATGLAVSAVGRQLDRQKLVHLAIPPVQREPGRIIGEVLTTDHFGNLTTNITRTDLQQLAIEGNNVVTTINTRHIRGIRAAYAEVGPGELLCLFNSRAYLEVAINLGNAARLLAAGPGAQIELSPAAPIIHKME
ncbi:MAG: hypothetical protein A2521_15455 [Deltaproteobacteria bacterium RIFOXYD12_FULL_57_12]|nr:MAG: hypothetical protein A2521_15455 [Deltaproteobacteria bacterium RIFOXYD12_FULL_57_12]